ncbi:MAG: low specificity L-threonine aldolase, partial [Gammaproteobacteria bacterium]|nr:low specificity L-threonine aldolase [Gammaproteobacteria bacterium]
IAEALRFKHQFGGAMRQAGIIAAAGIYALQHNVDRLAEDHANAQRFARLIAQIDGIEVATDAIETNMVFFDVTGTGLSAPEVADRLLAAGVRIGAINERRMRAVTHLDVDAAGVEEAARALAAVVEAAHQPA